MALCVRNYPGLLQIWPNLPDCVVGCFLCVNAKHRRKATCYFGKWFALKARKLPLKVYDARNPSVYHTLRLEFCTECMLSLNMGLAGLSAITRMSEIRRLYPICSAWTGLSQDKDLRSSLEQETACSRIPGSGSCGLALWPPFPAGCPRPSVDLVSCSWLENEWASLSKEADDIPTSTGHPTAGFLTICTHLAGFAIARQKQLGEPPPKLLHWRAPLDGPPLVLLLRFLESGPPVMCALEKKLQFHDLFCWPFRKDWLLSFWPTGGPSLWCTDGLNWVDDFGAGFLGILEVTSETPVYSMLISHGEDFLVKLLRLQANQTVCMEWSCPSSSNMLILQLQLPQSHVPADQLKVGRRCRCWSYGLLRGLVHNPDLFLHNLVSGLFQDVL